jgi:plasmid stabilization system protein ParE
MNVSFNPVAKQEFAEAAGWYAEKAGERRATDFRNEVMHSLKLIAEHPNLGSPAAWKTRSLVVHRYPYTPSFIASKKTACAYLPSPTKAAAQSIGQGGGKPDCFYPACLSRLRVVSSHTHNSTPFGIFSFLILTS